MRYTKLALLIFGLGLGLGLVAVVGEIARLERFASAAMALGLVLLPVALFADGRGGRVLAWIAARLSRNRRRRARAKPSRKPPPRRRPARSAAAARPARRTRG